MFTLHEVYGILIIYNGVISLSILILNFYMASKNSFLEVDVFYKNSSLPKIALGDKIRITTYLDLPKESLADERKEKKRIQTFEGIVISKHLARENVNSTLTVRKIFQRGGMEKVFLINSPWTKNFEILGRSVVRKSKLYFLRKRTGKSARLRHRL